MSQNEVYETVVNILKPYVRDAEAFERIRLETDILEDLMVNSTRLVDVVLAFEDQFEIEIGDDDIDSVATVGDAVRLITQALH